ncbi:MAG: hypothetical protein AB1651_03330 [Pseudomonadota bacterium]
MEAAKDICAGEPPDGTSADGTRVADYVAAEDPYATPGFQSVGTQVSLLSTAQVPGTYTCVYHEIKDDPVPIDLMDERAAK